MWFLYNTLVAKAGTTEQADAAKPHVRVCAGQPGNVLSWQKEAVMEINVGTWVNRQLRWVFFALHFGGGFLLLWFIFYLARLSFYPLHGIPFALQTTVHTLYVVAGVVWGNVGWDAFKHIPRDASVSLFVYVLSRTLSPICVFIPIFAILFSVFSHGHYLDWKLACTSGNAGLLGIAVTVIVVQMFYRRSERGFFYRSWDN